MKAPVAEGEILAGKYRVERILGQGGMGVVVSATHMQLNQRVAIKLLLAGATAEVTERFLREARASVRLKSEHVARVIDVGELPSGAPYMVMEYLEGRDLSQLVRGSGAASVLDAVEYLLHACEAIAEAHAQGIVHRDLKPANLFLTSAADGSGTVKVLDFGISKTATSEGEEGAGMSLTKTSSILGSPLYMSPEQMQSARNADARSDVWSLGAILYELLTASVPFNATTFTDLILMANMEAPPPIAQFRPDVPPGLEAAVLRCLEKHAENRFQNVADLAWAIVPFGPASAQASAERASRTLAAAGIATGGPQSMRTPPVAEPKVAGSLTAMSASSPTVVATADRGKAIAMVAAAFVVVAAAIVVVVAGRSRTPDPVPAALADSARGAVASAPAPPTVPVTVAPAPMQEPSAAPIVSATTAAAPPVTAPRPAAPPRPIAPPPPPTAKRSPLEMPLK